MPTHLSRRSFLKATGSGLIGLALGACQPASQPTSNGGIQLVYSDWNTEWFPPMAQEMLMQFTAAHPDIHVFYIPDPDNVEEVILSQMQAGTAADVFTACCAYFPTVAQAGYALDLRPYVAADLDQETIDDWDEAQYNAFFTANGVQYGLPKYHGALALYYNKDLFDRYEVEYPTNSWNHDGYTRAMRLLTHDTDGDGEIDLWGSMLDISWDRIQMHVNGWGGHFVDPDDPSHCMMAEPEALGAMEWIRARMWDDRVMASFLDVENLSTRDAFSRGMVAMVEDGSWALKDILTNADFRVGVAPFPAGPMRHVTLATTDGFGIYANTRYPDEAWELLKFLISPAYGRAMARTHFLQPARASLVPDWVGYILDEFPERAEDTNIAAFADGQARGYSVTAEVFANMSDVQQLVESAWDRIFTLGEEPVTLMKEISDQIQAIQDGTG